MTYFLDANIISYIIKQVPSVITRIEELIRNNADIKIPIIAYYEIKRGLLTNNAKHFKRIPNLQVEVLQ